MAKEVLELDKSFTTDEAISILLENPGLRAVQLPASQVKRLAIPTVRFLNSHNVYVVTKEQAAGRPGFQVAEGLVAEAQKLKDAGKTLSETAKELKVAESTLYIHVWKGLK